MQPERPECQCLACAQLQHHQVNDTPLLLAIAVILLVGGLVWLTGQVAGLLTSGTWPHVSPSELLGILTRLRDHAGDPAAAWPASVRGRLPGPLGMYATLAGLLATPLALGMLAWWLHQPPAPPRLPATPAPRGRRALPPVRHPDLPMLPPSSTTGRRRDRDHPLRAADRAHWPRAQWRGRAGVGRHQPRGGPPLRFRLWFRRHVRAAELPAIRLHDMRHSYATAGLAAGVPPKVMSERLGHATVAFTLDTYTSALPAMDKTAADVVASLILGTEEGGGSRTAT